jgi:hypothetical protein
MFFEPNLQRPDYFVPRVIEAQVLQARGQERVRRLSARGFKSGRRTYPISNKLAPQGPVAASSDTAQDWQSELSKQ